MAQHGASNWRRTSKVQLMRSCKRLCAWQKSCHSNESKNWLEKSDMQQQQSQREIFWWRQWKNSAGETANSLVEIFPSCKASIPRLENAAEGSCTWTNNGKGIGHGRPRISGLGRCICRGCWRRLDNRKICTGPNNLSLGTAKKSAGQADNANKLRGGLRYKLSINGRKASGMACVGRNIWHRKTLI